ncbi:TaqI-like C-terminal specificity domain-containing protein [Algoriphagus sp. CAU 1675]|uniref:Eco57I restriction-modification methylase domain-containing protein n=1 Tax=Algoriphagus sp. CAU 1675 TaxID=3032597 RepID=UPI0023DC2F39|nr:TaqI-like C-terminal specificity domain-containing protein [Algoriphagus sp. CAU 1675]MDF2158023.1 N-6 DNA methylase [Algoriphagus sp. CAU 1675]
MHEAFGAYLTYFHNPRIRENIRASKEEQFQEGFLRELFVKILGYTINPEPDYNLTTELKNIKDSKKTDGAIMKDGSALAVIELKGTDTKDLDKIRDQAFNYKNNQPDCIYVITSNFEKLRFYIDNAVDFVEFNVLGMQWEEFQLFWLLLHKENLLSGIPKKVKEESLLAEEQVTKKLYKDYSTFKQELWQDLVRQNPEEDELVLYKKSQKLLDRFLFIFFAEDKGLLPPNSIMEIVNQWRSLQELDAYVPLYKRFNLYFGYLNTGRIQPGKAEIHAYNGGLFAPDPILDTLVISDEVLDKHVRKLTEYDFESEVDTNILGHIFEHSLNDIENVRAQIAGETVDKSKTKRKRDGVFYTPKYITKYIVDNTLGRLCTEKKAELGIIDEDFAEGKRGRQKKTIQKLKERLDSYRNWLLQLTICDPACGSGAFLNQVLEFLIAEHRYVDELEAQLFDTPLILPNVENHILENNIFGVDINEESVEIARLSLWLRTAKKGRKLSSLNSNIKVGNSLIDDPEVAGDLAFNWAEQFPQVFAKGGFDVVVGNPPYVLCQPSNTPIKVLDFYKTFEVACYKIDLFHLFFEKSLKILQDSGKLGFITPNTYLTNKYISPLRKFILNQTDIELIINHEKNVFPEASVDVSTIILNKIKKKNNFVLIYKDVNSEFIEIGSKPQSQWECDSDSIFNIKSEFAFNFKNFIELGKICNTYFGIQAYDRTSSISESKINESFLEIIDGGDVFPFEYAKPRKFFNYRPEMIKSGGDWKVYSKERIVIRQIGQVPIVGLSRANILASNTLYSVYPKTDNFSLRYLLCILNSSLIKRYWLSKYSDSKLLFPKIKGFQLKELPIVNLGLKDQEIFEDFGGQVLELKDRLSLLKESFVLFINKKFSQLELNKNFLSEKDFVNFIGELNKAKVKLSLSEEAEWMAYFTEQKAKASALQAEITRLDREIDALVYELYGLTEEEIRIVENQK